MKSNLWVKTVLNGYKYLEGIAEAIDKLVDRQAMNSFYNFCSQVDNGVMAVSERIIDLIERKKKLVNLKVLVDKCLEGCQLECAQILIEKYIDNDKSEEIAQRHGLAMRTYFRRLAEAEETFRSQMSRYGYNDEKLDNLFSEERWIMDIYNSFEEKELGIEREKEVC